MDQALVVNAQHRRVQANSCQDASAAYTYIIEQSIAKAARIKTYPFAFAFSQEGEKLLARLDDVQRLNQKHEQASAGLNQAMYVVE